MNDNQRRDDRKTAGTSVGFRRPSEPSYKVALHDLSPGGARIDVRGRLEADQMVWVALPGLQAQQCRVRWTDGWVAGLEFEQPLHPSVFQHVAGRSAA